MCSEWGLMSLCAAVSASLLKHFRVYFLSLSLGKIRRHRERVLRVLRVFETEHLGNIILGFFNVKFCLQSLIIDGEGVCLLVCLAVWCGGLCVTDLGSRVLAAARDFTVRGETWIVCPPPSHPLFMSFYMNGHD